MCFSRESWPKNRQQLKIKKQPKHPWQGYEIKKNEHTPPSAG